MGFRCPACRKDFGTNKSALSTHLGACELGRLMVAGTLRAAEDEVAQTVFGIGKSDELDVHVKNRNRHILESSSLELDSSGKKLLIRSPLDSNHTLVLGTRAYGKGFTKPH